MLDGKYMMSMLRTIEYISDAANIPAIAFFKFSFVTPIPAKSLFFEAYTKGNKSQAIIIPKALAGLSITPESRGTVIIHATNPKASQHFEFLFAIPNI
ncbi:MAG: hypothetical protein WC788_08500 [Candidatus Paceibacterota bacterium]